MTRWLLTGATGFIGLNLAEHLLRRGDRVRALVRDRARAAELAAMGAELAVGDVASAETLPPAVAGVDVIVHLAGLTKALTAAELFRVNAGGTRALAEVAAALGRPRLVLVSSLAAAGPSRAGAPRREEDRPAPVSRYGESKLAAEEHVRAFARSLEISVVRPPVVYGPRDKELLPVLFRMARTGVIVKSGFGEKRYSLVHVDDLVDLVVRTTWRGRRLGAAGSEGIYFADDGVEHRWDDVARATLAALGTRGVVVPLPEAAGWLAAGAATLAAQLTGKPAMLSFDKLKEIREAAWTCSSDRARRELGWEPRYPLVEGIRQSAEWFRSRGML